MRKWHEVLVVTGGSTPQVVTETIFGLVTRSNYPIIPSKIVCVVTKGVANGFGANFEAALRELQQAFGLAADWERRESAWHTAQTGLFIEFASHDDLRPIEDIRSEADAIRFGNLVSEIVRTETLHDGSRVHLSLAGGRKTMSFHGGAAMSLFGRAQDELSHVLVHPPEYEGCDDFWFPTKHSRMVRHKDGRSFEANEAAIELSRIPFLRVRDRLPKELLKRSMDYATHVAQTNAALGRVPLFLELITSERRVRIGDLVDFTLPNTEFALYQLMAEWKLKAHRGAGPRGVGFEHEGWLTARMFEYPEQYSPNPIERFIAIYTDTFQSSTERSDGMRHLVIAKPIDESQRMGNESDLQRWKSRLIAALQTHLHDPDLADRFGAPRSAIKVRTEVDGKKSNRIVFGLRLEPRELIIRLD